MVHIYPFNAFASSEGGGNQGREMDQKSMRAAAPNRFSVTRSYDRSVVIDRDNDDMKGSCMQTLAREAEVSRQTPVVVLSRCRSREKEHDLTGNSVCSKHGITFRNVKEFIDGGILELMKEQSFLIYSQETGAGGGHRQVGICAALAVEDCLKGSIKRHEKVTKEISVAQRRLTNPQPRNVDPVMMMYRQSDVIQAIIDKITTRDVPVSMQARSRHGSRLGLAEDDEVVTTGMPDDHKIWSVTDEHDIEALRTAFLKVDSLYIADGHHRTAAACRMALLNRGREGQRTASHTKYLLGFLYPHTHMRVLPYNRCVTSLGDQSPEQFLRLVSSVFRITEHNSGRSIRFDDCVTTESIRLEDVHCDPSIVPSTGSVPSGSATLSLNLSLVNPSSVSASTADPCSSPGSPEKSIVRGLVLSMDSESDSDSDIEADTISELEDQEDVESITSRFHRLNCSGRSSGRTSSSSERSRSYLDSEKRQQDDAVCRLEIDSDDPLDKIHDTYLSPKALGLLVRDREREIDRERQSSPVSNGDEMLEREKRLIGPRQSHIISMYFEGRWLDLCPREAVVEKEGDPLSSLDIQVLFERLLRPLLGIECPRTDHRMIYVCGSEGLTGLESRVDSKLATLAFCVGRVTVSDIMRVADAGQLMPPKATCFSPKPLPGLLVRLH